jgi:hypothetical protein
LKSLIAKSNETAEQHMDLIASTDGELSLESLVSQQLAVLKKQGKHAIGETGLQQLLANVKRAEVDLRVVDQDGLLMLGVVV